MSSQPTGSAALSTLNLWATALQDLEPEERVIINNHTKDTKPTDVLQVVENRRQEAWKNRTSFKRSNGEVVFLHDIFAKVAQWVRKFVEVGDAVVQYDPAHAALPWAAVRFILQASINDIQCQAAVLESVEDVAQTIPLGAIHECLYLADPSAAAAPLKANLTKLYTLCWSSLARAFRYHDQGKMKRVFKSILDLDSDMSNLSRSIANQWALVERSATLVRAEGFISHMSKSQSRNEELLRMMDEIKTPVSRIETHVEGVHQALSEMQRDRILDSISTIPYPQHQAKVSKSVLSGTGKWLLDHHVVRNWFSSSASEILWLHGIPGSGKSCLVSVVVQKLITESAHNPSSHPVYFYCTRSPAERERADPTHILRSILRQLSMPRSTSTLPSCVVDNYNKERGSFLDLSDTLDLIIDIIKSRTITFIVLDALDECDSNLRYELIDALETILRESQSLVKIFVSSRNDSDLVCWLKEYPNKEILSSDNQVDLTAFVDAEVDKRVDGRPRRLLRARKISDALRDDIKRTLKAQAQGMFRWAELQLQYLCKLLTEDDVRQRLGALPKDLTGIYHDIYQRNMSDLRDIDPQYEVDAKKVFHLMLTSDRPWNPVDMANLLEPASNAALRNTDKVFGLTFHLLTHDKELNILRFAHLSVREYFETSLSEFTPPRSMEANVTACLDYLEKTREFGFRPLSYPSDWWYKNVIKVPNKEISAQLADRLVDFFIRDTRTFQSWIREILEEDGSIYIERSGISVDDLVSNDSSMVFTACALGLEDVVSRLIEAQPRSVLARNRKGETVFRFVCTRVQNANILSILLRSKRVENHERSAGLRAALSYTDPSVAVIKGLLESGADPNEILWEDQKSPLYRAAYHGCIEAVELLLTYGADPNLPSGQWCENALDTALRRRDGSCDIVRKLLESGARVENVDNWRDSPLRSAVTAGREDFVTALLSFGADVNALDAQRVADEYCTSALFWAIDRGEIQIARQLLSHGADAVPRNDKERTIFEDLLFSGNTELAKSLLFAPNQDLRLTAIIQAARLLEEDELMMRLEILKEQNSDAQELSRAMELAAESCLPKVFEQLVDHASDRSLLYSLETQVLDGVVRQGQVEMFNKLWTSLLGRKPTSNTGDNPASAELGFDDAFIASLYAPAEFGIWTRFRSLLENAAKSGSAAIFQRILADGEMPTINRDGRLGAYLGAMPSSTTPPTTATDKSGSTTNEIQSYGALYLHAAIEAGQADIVQLLLRLGADVNGITPGWCDQSALCIALCGREHVGIIKLLLNSGADVNARMACTIPSKFFHDSYYGTALTMALLRANKAEETSSTVIEALLEHGADANAADDKEGSILQLAVSQRHIGATELLLAYGADVNKGGGTYGSPLIAAVASGFDLDKRETLIEILLKNGADVNKSGGHYGSALIAAVLFAQDYSTGTRFIELLLKNGADVNAQHPGEYETAFRAALSKRSDGSLSQQIFQLFIAHNADLSAIGRDGTQALYVACASGACDELRAEYLLSHGADVNASGGEYGNALQAACAGHASSKVVELLIDKGAEVNAKGGRFGNALQAASHTGMPRPVEILLAKGADIRANEGEYGHALQAAAISFNPVPTMKLLLAHEADINACGGKYGTALQAACANKSASKAKPAINLLISRGADLNMRAGKYGHALICAVAEEWDFLPQNELEPVNILLNAGADINCSHEMYGNALYAACYNYYMPVMELLIERGISLTQLAGEHEHALFVACLESKPRKHWPGVKDDKRVRVLLDNGVDVNIRGKRYSCALEVAIKAGNLAAAKLLIERGADVHVETANDGSLLDIAIRLSRSATNDVEEENENDVGEEDESDFEEEDDVFLVPDHSSAIVELLRANGA